MVGSTREKVCNLKNNMALPAGSIIGFRRRPQEAGYAMAALLVAMSVMAIMLSVAMPTWSQMIRREKEAELIFRGEQYARAINQYQRKYANQSPANLDVLIKERMLRKKFKDPLSPNEDGEFQLLYFQTGTGPQGSGAARRGVARWLARHKLTRHWLSRHLARRRFSRQWLARCWYGWQSRRLNWPIGWADGKRRCRRRRQQEHGSVSQGLQRQEPVQRVAVHRHGIVVTCWGRRGRRRFSWRPRWAAARAWNR